MYVPINSSSKLIQNHNSLKSTCILFNTKPGKEFLLTFEHFSGLLINRALSVRPWLCLCLSGSTR